MKATATIVLALGIVGVAAAYDLGNQAPVKPVVTYPDNIPKAERHGGDTVETAFLIPSLPFQDTGTTDGYHNDYFAFCGDNARDVVYSLVPAVGTYAIDVDLCHSSYNTVVFVYDSNLNILDCNDDFHYGPPCNMHTSKLENVHVVAGQTYYIVVDGHGAASGTYVIDVTGYDECIVECYSHGQNSLIMQESEPPLVNGYVDSYNGGCNTLGYPFQFLGSWPWGIDLCGVSGWYLVNGSQYRDTDWYVVEMPWADPLEITADADYATYIFELGPQDCENIGVIQSVVAGPCQETTMTITGYVPWSPVWLWVGPTSWDAPSNPFEYDYVCWIWGDWHIATEATTWSTVKALFE